MTRAAVVLLTLAAALPANAQQARDAAEQAAAWQARIDSLRAVEEQLAAAVAREPEPDDADDVSVDLDTVVAGRYVLIARASDAPRVLTLVAAAAARVDERLGTTRDESTDTLVVTDGRYLRELAELSGRPSIGTLFLQRGDTRVQTQRRVEAVLADRRTRLLPDPLATWLSGAGLGHVAFDRTYRQLALAQDDAARRCLARTERCFAAAALGGDGRATLLAEAVRLGGPGSLARVRGVTVEAQLEAIAGEPLDSILASWRTRIIAARPSAYAGLGGSLLATLVWVTLLTAFALRSTRCRLG